MEAEANPFPKEDTTPPVTKMNLLMLVISIYIHLLTIPIFPLLCKEGGGEVEFRSGWTGRV